MGAIAARLEPYQQLEHELARWAGYPAENLTVCSSGTAALHLALESFHLPPGSEVIVPDFTMIACARAVTLAGLKPVFVDCGDDGLMDAKWLHGGAGYPLTISAIIPVHVYGRRCNMNRVIEFASVNNLAVIEDLAEAHGVKPHQKTDAACWSFYRNKIVAGEEGGAVAFRNPKCAERARQLRSLGFTERHDFNHVPRGHNYRLANSLARPISDSLRHIHDSLAQRRLIESWYDAACPDEWKMPPRDVPWVYDFRIRGLTNQDKLVTELNRQGIAARHGFKPMSQQQEYRDCRVIGSGNAARLAREIVYLPIQPGITTEETARRAFNLIRYLVKHGD